MPTDTFAITTDNDDGWGVYEGIYPPSSTWYDGTGFSDTVATIEKTRPDAGTFHYFGMAFLRFDTSSIDDGATIDSAVLQLYVTATANASGLLLLADYYDFGGEPSVAGDYTETISSSIIASTSVASLTASAVNNISLTDLTGIDVGGVTGIRLGLSATGGALPSTTANQVKIALLENTSFQEPRLEVTYTVGGSTVSYLQLLGIG